MLLLGERHGEKRMKTKFSTKKLVATAVLTALTTATTFAIKIPTIATEGYVNVGDAVVMFASITLGPAVGFIAGGLGSCLSDLISGYPHWILPTFIIKGIEGLLVALIFRLFKKTKLNEYVSAGISAAIGAVVMVAGYFAASAIMKGSVAVALTGVPGNCLQGLFGVILSEVLLVAAKKTKITEKLQSDFGSDGNKDKKTEKEGVKSEENKAGDDTDGK